jgi:histidyl-tRNA synthetase
VLDNSIKWLEKLGCTVVYDLTIVRWLWYYTDIVFETFIEHEINLWSICSGGGYENFTKFIDPKNIYSGIGGSIGLSRLMELILDQKSESNESESYMFLNFEDTFDHVLRLYQQFLSEWKICELYPIEAKFGKQLEYADKKWCQYAVILWSSELEKGEYQIKDLKSGETTIKKL